MKDDQIHQLSMLVDNNDAETVIKSVEEIFSIHFGNENYSKVKKAYELVTTLFKGDFSGYRECNTEYHNLNHTLDAFLATARLMDGWIIDKNEIDGDLAKNLLIAALLHDTGYIQEEDDKAGTGAKYTKVHVKRSMEFLLKNASTFDLSTSEVDHIKNYIEFTGLNSNFTRDAPDVHYIAGTILGTADLLGQMSDRAYLEKLLFLYYEFQEAGFEGFDTEFDILKKTFDFYESTMHRMEFNLRMSYKFAHTHFKVRHGIDENLYLKAINNQMNYLQTIIDDEKTNFRKKLHRLDIENIEKKYT